MKKEDSIKLCIEQDSEFKNQIINGCPNPSTGINIVINEEYLIKSESKYPIKESVCFFLLDLLDATQAVVDGKDVSIHFPTNPAYLDFRNCGEDVEISFRYTGDTYKSRYSVGKEELLNEFATKSEEVINRIIKYDSGAEGDELILDIRKKISILRN